jgi:hypothetical protein
MQVFQDEIKRLNGKLEGVYQFKLLSLMVVLTTK